MTLAPLFALSPSLLAIGFSVLLVLGLVAAEEADLRGVAPVRADDAEACS